jgi:DNA-binding transcriptional ArsR family regulator
MEQWWDELPPLPPEWEKFIDDHDCCNDPPRSRNGNGIYQGRDGLRERKRPPDLGWWRERLSGDGLCDRRFDPLKYIVPYLLPEGVTLLVGRPKIGKSWLLQQIAGTIAKGDVTLVAPNGNPPASGDVLYLALEDNWRRLQRRMTKHYGGLKDNWPKRLEFAIEWLRLDEGGLDGIGEWCADRPEPRLVVIDTLARVRAPKRAGQTDYEADMEAAEGLVRLCRVHSGLSVIVAHHDRKQEAGDVYDTVSGTLGLQGGVDTIALLKRTGAGTTLYVRGRDLEEEIEKAVNFDRDTARWHILGEATEVYRSNSRKAILDLLKECGSLTPRQLADQLEGMSHANAKQALNRLAKDGVLENHGGAYRLPGDTLNPVSPAVTGPVSPD